MSDEDLMELYQSGDAGAFELLYERFRAKTYGYLMKKGLNKNNADEVFQRSFLKFHQNRQKYDRRFKVAAWLFTILHSTLIDFYRQQSRQSRETRLDDLDNIEHFPQTPKENAETSLKGLSESEIKILKQRYFDEQTYEDIAINAGISTLNARQKISRILKKLRQNLNRRHNESSS